MFERLKLKRKIKLLNKRIDIENSDDARYELAMIYLDLKYYLEFLILKNKS